MQANHREPKTNVLDDIVVATHHLGGQIDRKTTEILRRSLLDQKRSLLRRRREALDEEEQLLAEREPDWEDLAATQTSAALLE